MPSKQKNTPATRVPRVTLEDIGRKLGLSKRSVSQALHERPSTAKVSEETRKKVQALAQKLGYRHNMAARTLTTGRSGMLGILSFHAQMHIRLTQTALVVREFTRHGVTPLVLLADEDLKLKSSDASPSVNALLDAGVDGVLALSPPEECTEQIERLKTHGVAVFSIGLPRVPDIPTYTTDPARGFQLVTQHLVDQGCRSITLLARLEKDETAEHTLRFAQYANAGFQKAAQEAKQKRKKTTFSIHEAPFGTEDSHDDIPHWYLPGYLGMRELIDQGKVPDALVCQVDDWAMGAMRACAEAGIRIPEEMAIAGYRNDPTSAVGTVPLTSVAEPFEELCAKAVADLIRATRGEPVQNPSPTILPGRLIVRQSSRRLPETTSRSSP